MTENKCTCQEKIQLFSDTQKEFIRDNLKDHVAQPNLVIDKVEEALCTHAVKVSRSIGKSLAEKLVGLIFPKNR